MNKAGRARAIVVWAAISDMALQGEHITVEAVRRRCGIASKDTVAYHLDCLEALGYISQGPERAQSTWVVQVPLYPLKLTKGTWAIATIGATVPPN
jgi:hypothetical protein